MEQVLDDHRDTNNPAALELLRATDAHLAASVRAGRDVEATCDDATAQPRNRLAASAMADGFIAARSGSESAIARAFLADPTAQLDTSCVDALTAPTFS